MAARRGSLNNHCEPKTLLCVCSNMWLTVVCFCKQLLLSCVCNWVTTLVLPARPRVIATAATICAVPLPLARRCLSCRIPWHVCHPGHGVACVFCSCVAGGFIPRASPYHHRHLVSQRERIRGFEFSTKQYVTFQRHAISKVNWLLRTPVAMSYERAKLLVYWARSCRAMHSRARASTTSGMLPSHQIAP